LPLKNAAILRANFAGPEIETGGKFAIIFSRQFTTEASDGVYARSIGPWPVVSVDVAPDRALGGPAIGA
jgi:hypothetical protein